MPKRGKRAPKLSQEFNDLLIDFMKVDAEKVRAHMATVSQKISGKPRTARRKAKKKS